MAVEMTPRQFLESSWFKLLWRGVIVVGIPVLSGLSAYAGWTLNSVYAQQDDLSQQIVSIKVEQSSFQDTQTDIAVVNDAFQDDITSDVAAVDVKVDKVADAVSSVREDLGTVKEDVAAIAGALKVILGRDVAATRFELMP